MRLPSYQRGFTLVELIMVIVIMGVIGGMVSVFMKSPIDAYFDSARRAALTDVADTAVRRMGRDVHRALPNSLRPLANSTCIEFIPTKTGGRYRADETAAGLSFSAPPDTSFNMLGDNGALPPDQRIADGDSIVVYNLGIVGSDAYTTGNRATVNGAPVVALAPPETTIAITTTQPVTAPTFSLASGGNRFHVVPAAEHTVTYVCAGAGTVAGDGSGTLYRYVRDFNAAHSCPATPGEVATMVAAGATPLARNVSACSFVYNGTDLQRNATVQIILALTRSNETVGLYHEVHVDNTP
jgi:MSHA biogenesis protein MshO